MITKRFSIQRQDTPSGRSYWHDFDVVWREGMTLTQALLEIQKKPVTIDAKAVAPVVSDSQCQQGLCGTCTILVNGKATLACTTLVEKLSEPIQLQPLSKFPVLRDLCVDRAQTSLENTRIQNWIAIDQVQPLSEESIVSMDPTTLSWQKKWSACIDCSACVEACPNYNASSPYLGPAVVVHAERFNSHSIGQELKAERIQTLMGKAGMVSCDNTQNCVRVCPQEIPITTAIAKIKRQITIQTIKNFFG